MYSYIFVYTSHVVMVYTPDVFPYFKICVVIKNIKMTSYIYFYTDDSFLLTFIKHLTNLYYFTVVTIITKIINAAVYNISIISNF